MVVNVVVANASFMSTVIKAEHLSSESVRKGYAFPDKDDNLINYEGESAQLMIPSGVLQEIISKSTKCSNLQFIKWNSLYTVAMMHLL